MYAYQSRGRCMRTSSNLYTGKNFVCELHNWHEKVKNRVDDKFQTNRFNEWLVGYCAFGKIFLNMSPTMTMSNCLN